MRKAGIIVHGSSHLSNVGPSDFGHIVGICVC